MSNHMSYQILYTFSKAMTTHRLWRRPGADPNDISAERALSPTDQRHQLRVQYQFQSPVATTAPDFWRPWGAAGLWAVT